MRKLTRRTFNRLLGASGAAAAASLAAPGIVQAASKRVVVIGGGFGGATAAKYLKRFDKTIDVTLVEPNSRFVTCPFSNTVIGGLNDIRFITQNFDALKAMGVKVIHDLAAQVDAARSQVKLTGGQTLPYDRCIVSPGIDFQWGAVKGGTEDIVNHIPHAWKAGPQTLLLKKQLEAMPDGGVFVLSPPPKPVSLPARAR